MIPHTDIIFDIPNRIAVFQEGSPAGQKLIIPHPAQMLLPWNALYSVFQQILGVDMQLLAQLTQKVQPAQLAAFDPNGVKVM